MEAKLSATLGLSAPDPNDHLLLVDFPSLLTQFRTLSTQNPSILPQNNSPPFASISVSTDPQTKPRFLNWHKPTLKPRFESRKCEEPATTCNRSIPLASTAVSAETLTTPKFPKWLKPASRNSPRIQSLIKNLSVFERALIGAGAGGIAGAFTYVCLHPLDTIKTKLQTKGASQLYSSTFDAFVKTFQTKGIMGFYSGVSAVIIGSTASSAVYFGTCEFGKSILSKFDNYPSLLIPPTAGAMGNIVSSAIMVPKELITQRMQAGAKGRSWQVVMKILEKDGVLGLYAGYFATLLRNLPSGVLSYSSFEYLKAAVLSRTGRNNLEPIQSVCCGALAGAISASLTTPLDVVKTRLMTQVQSDAVDKVAAAIHTGVAATVKQILKEEGWIGLTRGMGPRVVHSACFSALGYFAFETARLTILHRYLKQKELSESDIALA